MYSENLQKLTKQILAERGLTQEALGAIVGTSQAAVGRWVAGTVKSISLGSEIGLAAYLGVSRDELLQYFKTGKWDKPLPKPKTQDERIAELESKVAQLTDSRVAETPGAYSVATGELRSMPVIAIALQDAFIGAGHDWRRPENIAKAYGVWLMPEDRGGCGAKKDPGFTLGQFQNFVWGLSKPRARDVPALAVLMRRFTNDPAWTSTAVQALIKANGNSAPTLAC